MRLYSLFLTAICRRREAPAGLTSRLVRLRGAHAVGAVTRPPTGVFLLYYRGADPAVCLGTWIIPQIRSFRRWRKPMTKPRSINRVLPKPPNSGTHPPAQCQRTAPNETAD